MMTEPSPGDRLDEVLDGLAPIAVAVSGGVDSMTLAAAAHARLGAGSVMYHAVSPAVPPEATARVREHARERGWRLKVIDAGEFSDPDYLRNPVDRCYFCKSNLYGAIARLTDSTIASGTNLDDLKDFRPGLEAAKTFAVRHPYVEAGIDKVSVRALARECGLDEMADLPAAPCLSSRIETDLPVTAEVLRFVHAVERLVDGEIRPQAVRCRVFRDGVAVQLDRHGLARALSAESAGLRASVRRLCADYGHKATVRFEVYRMGSAFRGPKPGRRRA